jgi:pimeloyl-ACP methyl ester carboxylesterase
MSTTATEPQATGTRAMAVTHHRTATVDGVNIFYRESGPADAPVVLLLHGFPASSHMFRNLSPDQRDHGPWMGDALAGRLLRRWYVAGQRSGLGPGLRLVCCGHRWVLPCSRYCGREWPVARPTVRARKVRSGRRARFPYRGVIRARQGAAWDRSIASLSRLAHYGTTRRHLNHTELSTCLPRRFRLFGHSPSVVDSPRAREADSPGTAPRGQASP